MKGKEILLQLRNVLQAFQFSRSHTHRYKTSLSKGRTIIFSSGGGGIVISTHCADNFLKIPQISHNRGGLCRQFFSDAPLGQTIYFSNFSHADNFFPIMIPPLGKNNGPSLRGNLYSVHW